MTKIFDKKNTIFVQMASYRDPQLIPTLKDLITNAKHPELLRISVCWQHGADQPLEQYTENGFKVVKTATALDHTVHYLTLKEAKIELIDIHYFKTHGACWARNLIQQYYDYEKYTLQLDSHHRFIEGWDDAVIEMLESVRDVSPKPLLTAYIPSFDPENDPAGRVMVPWKQNFDRFIPEGTFFTIPSTIDHWEEMTKPLLTAYYSAHFAFADGIFAIEVQHDDSQFFHGEEVGVGVRAWTHGYDLYHPHRVIAWHEYTRQYPGNKKIWDDFTTSEKNKGNVAEDWVEMNNKSHHRFRVLFGMDGEDPTSIEFGKYGFGTVRTLKQFEEFAGISFKYRGAQQRTLDHISPVMPWKTYDNDEEWKATISRSNDVRICFHKNELGEVLDDYDFWYVGVHNSSAQEIYRKDLTESEIKQKLKEDFIDYRFIYISPPDNVAKTYTIWPHSKSKGWMNKLDKIIDMY